MMKALLQKKILLVVALLVLAGGAFFLFGSSSSEIDFNAQVKPILNKKCISCHGGVRRKGGFSLLFRSEAVAVNESGKPAIIPGDPDRSELIKRITASDPEERMPYKHEPLSKAEIKILRQWIKQGAKWGDHWAYVAVKETAIPEVENKTWAKNGIDKFVLKKLEETALTPSATADKNTLLRRVSLDLIGLPAAPSAAKQYLSDNTEKAYENLVDSLLASKHFGEKWAAMWLDLARYADTKGYERDDSRTIWHYRDWLINAFNADKPYDQFLTEQIAGDMLPNATDAQLIATAFHRNTMTNDEGGTDNEEFRTAAVIDRVNTTWEALMGTTFSCVQCHSHPYDPFKHEEYYKFMAFFNNTRDEDTEADYPLLRHYNDSALQKMDELLTWLKQNVSAEKADEIKKFLKTWQPAINSLNCDQFVNSELADTKWLAMRNKGVCRLKNVDLDKKDELIFRFQSAVKGGTWSIHLDKPDGPLLVTTDIPDTKFKLTFKTIPFALQSGIHDLYFKYTNNNLAKPEYSGVWFDWFYFTEKFPGQDKQGYEAMHKRFNDLAKMEFPTTPIMMDNPSDMHRISYVFERGNWLLKTDKVEPAVPQSLNALPKNAPANRLGLSMWLVSKENPLVSRTIVNRFWEQIFGNGIAETLEDLGTQGIPPTHKDLLDWLSWQMMNDYKWSMKKLLKEIVMSSTYRQDSKVTAELLEKDPSNKLFARGPRVRLSAEQIRDQALAISGLLSEKICGPSVMPYQPKGLWLSPWNGADWKKSDGEDQYRRALYTYWKRTSPYPGMMTFDAAAREVCVARRIKTNTPLQALVTLNDSAYVEAAKYLAVKLQKEHPNDVAVQIKSGYQQATGKMPNEKSYAALRKLYDTALNRYKKDGETSALTLVANAIMNLDEFVTKN